MIDLSMAYGHGRTASAVATAAVLVAAGCGRLGFDELPAGDAEAPCTPAIAITELDMGHDFGCVQLADGTLHCWGTNELGQLGNGLRTSSTMLVSPTGLLGAVSAFSTGFHHTCAISFGDVFCWGRNDIGQLGTGDRISRVVPTRVTLPTPMVGVSAGGLTTCAWNDTGAMYCWGQSSGTATQQSNTPQLVVGPPAIMMATISSSNRRGSDDHGCALATTGAAYCWGSNTSYQLGDGTMTEQITPVASASGLAFTSITVGDAHSCGRTSGGDVYCWGRNSDGQVGVSAPALIQQPMRIAVTDATAIDATGENTCALTGDGSVYCWGDNDERVLGRSGFDAYAPELIAVPPSQTIAVGSDTMCALGRDGVLRCWGADRAGLISGRVASPQTTTIPDAIQIEAGGTTTCALTVLGAVKCWGAGSLGQLGTGTSSEPSATPVDINLPRAATAISVGSHHACAVLDDQTVACWGWNEQSQINAGAEIQPPVVVTGLPAGIIAVSAGGSTTCANTTTETWCWGANSEGEQGRTGAGSDTPMLSQFAVGTLVMGSAHSCVFDGGGVAYCSGRNNEGQIGTGSFSDQQAPFMLVISQINTMATGVAHSCAASAASGQLWCWGDHIAGQAGVGFDTVVPSPTIVSTAFSYTGLVAGRSHTCGRNAAGDVRCWGSDAYGQMGNGSYASIAAPIDASQLSGTGVLRLAAGDQHTCVLESGGTIRCAGADDVGQLGGTEPVASAAPRQAALTCSP